MYIKNKTNQTFNFEMRTHKIYEVSKYKNGWIKYQSCNDYMLEIMTKNELFLDVEVLSLCGNMSVENSKKTLWVENQLNVNVNDSNYQIYILSQLKGITAMKAAKIFEEYDISSINQLIDLINNGTHIKGFGPKKVEDLKELQKKFQDQKVYHDINYIIEHPNASKKISSTVNSVDDLLKHPYKTMVFAGLRWDVLDRIGLDKLKVDIEDHERNKFLIWHLFSKNRELSNCSYSEYDKLIEILSQHEIFGDLKEYIYNHELLHVEDEKVYLKDIYEYECGIPALLNDCGKFNFYGDESTLNESIKDFETFSDILLDETQKDALKIAIKNSISIITGGAGTGKSTIINGINIILESTQNVECILLAPTNRAAVRMKECAHKKANTIHGLIALAKYVLPNQKNQRDRDYSLKEFMNISYGEKRIIVDESSMIPIPLMYELLDSIAYINQETRINITGICFIGDPNQLPPVGRGKVLIDMIDSNCYQHYKLTVTFRQKDGNILNQALKVMNTEIIDRMQKKDFYTFSIDEYIKSKGRQDLLKETDNKAIEEQRLRIVNEQLINKINQIYIAYSNEYQEEYERYSNIQICVATNALRNKINYKYAKSYDRPDKGEIYNFAVGDKVLNKENMKDVNICNGDFGIVEYVKREFRKNGDLKNIELKVYFYESNKRFSYDITNINNLTYGYACTVHKMQGSEFKKVIIVLDSFNVMLTDYKWMYTAITRAKETVSIVTLKDKFISDICTNTNDMLRNTYLKQRLQNLNYKGGQ